MGGSGRVEKKWFPSLPLLSYESSASMKENPDRKKKNVSKINNQSAVIHEVIVHKSVHSFVAHNTLVLFLVTLNVTSKPVKSEVANKSVSNVHSKFVKSKFICKPVSNFPSKHVAPNVSCKPFGKVTRTLSIFFIRKSSSFVSDLHILPLLANF